MTKASVKIDFEGIHKKFSVQNKDRGRRALSNQMLADMNPYVPKKEGFLRTATSISLDGSEIYYHMNYASKQFNIRHRNYTEPNTGPRWDLKAKGLHMRDWEKAYVRGADL